jgi:NAD(P)H dehydrogenase (quinone)
MYGHVRQLAEAEKKGIEEAGGSADIYQYVTISSSTATTKLPPSQLTSHTESKRPFPKKS